VLRLKLAGKSVLDCLMPINDKISASFYGWISGVTSNCGHLPQTNVREPSGNKYALLVSKKMEDVAHGPPLAAGPHIAGSAGSVVTLRGWNHKQKFVNVSVFECSG